ncbi:MAG TPA: prepilin-type N-terminal cleavage/methylation domain-containing protein [Fimbriimonadaceae bacterium]|nr:prepilin-type N-terminal cleavage/methylation domain-containing protein [Fimbriimonadaceae bacterium]
MKRAFTLIELLVVIAIIAILAAILFPVFAQAKLAAKKSRAMAQMKQLGIAVYSYATDYDDYFVPSSIRPAVADPANPNPEIWPPKVMPYVKNQELFVAHDTNGKFATDWTIRQNQSIGYTDAAGVDQTATQCTEGAALPGCEGFASAANFSQAEEPASIGLFATTPHGVGGKWRGYVFNPYNGPTDPTNYKNGLPIIADYDYVVKNPGLSPGEMKPIYARYGGDSQGNGMTPVIFADSHAKIFSAKYMNSFGKIIWRFR